jgi:hypothetical protein
LLVRAPPAAPHARCARCARPASRARAPTTPRCATPAALRAAYPDAVASWQVAPAVAVCGNPAFGDYQCNNAMPLFQRLKAAGAPAASPRAVAEALLAALPASPMVAATRHA